VLLRLLVSSDRSVWPSNHVAEAVRLLGSSRLHAASVAIRCFCMPDWFAAATQHRFDAVSTHRWFPTMSDDDDDLKICASSESLRDWLLMTLVYNARYALWLIMKGFCSHISPRSQIAYIYDQLSCLCALKKIKKDVLTSSETKIGPWDNRCSNGMWPSLWSSTQSSCWRVGQI
jgi:hypothetical protein